MAIKHTPASIRQPAPFIRQPIRPAPIVPPSSAVAMVNQHQMVYATLAYDALVSPQQFDYGLNSRPIGQSVRVYRPDRVCKLVSLMFTSHINNNGTDAVFWWVARSTFMQDGQAIVVLDPASLQELGGNTEAYLAHTCIDGFNSSQTSSRDWLEESAPIFTPKEALSIFVAQKGIGQRTKAVALATFLVIE